ncbi:MAG: ribose-phosphate pyrophosphokinase [Bacteroidota bacterium]
MDVAPIRAGSPLPIAIVAGRSTPALAREIADELSQRLGEVTIRNFADGEIYVRFEESIRGTDLFLVQSTPAPADHWMELLLLVDAAKRASAARITAVVPYFGYARQDRKDQPRVSIAAKLCTNLLERAGADRILTMDLHAPQIQGFTDAPVDHLYGSRLFIDYVQEMEDTANLVVVAPDVGASKRARAYAERLQCDLALIDKRRPRANEVEVMHIIGQVNGKHALLVDDMIDTAGTLTQAAYALSEHGALSIMAACTHPLLSGPAYDRIERSPISKLLVTNTIPLQQTAQKIHVLSVASYFADAIQRIHNHDSVSTLFAE